MIFCYGFERKKKERKRKWEGGRKRERERERQRDMSARVCYSPFSAIFPRLLNVNLLLKKVTKLSTSTEYPRQMPLTHGSGQREGERERKKERERKRKSDTDRKGERKRETDRDTKREGFELEFCSLEQLPLVRVKSCLSEAYVCVCLCCFENAWPFWFAFFLANLAQTCNTHMLNDGIPCYCKQLAAYLSLCGGWVVSHLFCRCHKPWNLHDDSFLPSTVCVHVWQTPFDITLYEILYWIKLQAQ